MRWIYRSSNYGVVIKVWITHLFSSLLTLLLNLLYPINDSLQYLFYCRQQSLEELPKKKYSKFVGQHLLQSLFFKKVACASESPLNKVEGLRQTLVQVFSYEFCEIFKNTLFHRKTPGDCFCHLRMIHHLYSSQNWKLSSSDFHQVILQKERLNVQLFHVF